MSKLDTLGFQLSGTKYAQALYFILNPGSHAQLTTKVVQEIASRPVDVIGRSQASSWIVQPGNPMPGPMGSRSSARGFLAFRAILEGEHGNVKDL